MHINASCFVSVAVVAITVGCASSPESRGVERARAEPIAEPCAFQSEPTLVYGEGNDVLYRWDVEARDVYLEPRLPSDAAFLEFRRVFEEAGAAVRMPPMGQDRRAPRDEADAVRMERQRENRALLFAGSAGHVRPMNCLEGLLLAYQNARFSQLTHPFEFISHVLRREVAGVERYRIYFGAGDQEFIPRAVYGFDQVEVDIRDGWSFWTSLHNHPPHLPTQEEGRWGLGTPTPSTVDVHLYRRLHDRLGLQSAWVTNGFFSGDIPASAFMQLNAED